MPLVEEAAIFDVDFCGIVFFIVHVIRNHGTNLYNQ